MSAEPGMYVVLGDSIPTLPAQSSGPWGQWHPGWEEAAWDTAVTLSQCHSHSQGPGLLLL